MSRAEQDKMVAAVRLALADASPERMTSWWAARCRDLLEYVDELRAEAARLSPAAQLDNVAFALRMADGMCEAGLIPSELAARIKRTLLEQIGMPSGVLPVGPRPTAEFSETDSGSLDVRKP